MSGQKYLLVNPFGIGDVIFSTPLIEIIKDAYPDCFIGYICNKRAFEILKTNPKIDKIYVYEKDDFRECWRVSKIGCARKVIALLKAIRKERYDIAIDLSLQYQYSMFLASIGITRRVGFNYRKRGRFLTSKVDISGFNDKHVVEYYYDLLRLLSIDAKKDDKKPMVYVPESTSEWADVFLVQNGIHASDRIVGIIPGCGASWGKDAFYRRWSPWKFAAVADYAVSKHGLKTVIFGEEKEKDLCAKVHNQMRAHAIQACGQTSLMQFAALLDRCDLIITNDGGPMHIAAALRKKMIAIFGPVDEKVYGPYPPNPLFVTVKGKNACRPCYRNFKYRACEDLECLKSIRPEDIFSHIDRLIASLQNLEVA